MHDLPDPESPKIGWFCSFVPEELILAAGLNPVRLEGRVDRVKEADAIAFTNLCPYLKNLIDSGLQHRFDDLAGIVFANTCDGIRRMYDLWLRHVETPWTYMLEVPKNTSDEAIDYFAARILDLKNRLEADFGADISEEKLGRAIAVMNERRRWVEELFQGRKADPVGLKGSELLGLLARESSQPKSENPSWPGTRAERIDDEKSAPDGRPRIMVTGNLIHRPALFDMIERAGGAVVLFDGCNGLRHYAGQVEEGLPPITALARRYLLKPSCARMPGVGDRLDRMESLAREYGVDGVVFSGLKYCDYSLFEAPQAEKRFKETGTPLLVLENDYVWSDVERLRIRVEAFVEMIGSVL
ncbi:MAG: 2-hydroxyacyl-CoA dehydratase family protein [Proteobacteria bacterium]|nr:2-hydroxyacyl-CoA dehydratase family protein [Pseudomonadota bacterium]